MFEIVVCKLSLILSRLQCVYIIILFDEAGINSSDPYTNSEYDPAVIDG